MPAQDAYLESQVLTADPIELVRLLYRGAGDAVRAARAHLEARHIADRARQISKAHAILSHLLMTLDHSRGGELSQQLAALYDYLQRRLLEANLRQSGEPLREVEDLLGTLLSGWEAVGTPAQVAAVMEPAPAEEFTGYGGYAGVFAAGGTEYGPQSWSL